MINQRDQEMQLRKKANEKSIEIIKELMIRMIPSRIDDYLIFSDLWQPMDLSGFVKLTITGKSNNRHLDNVSVKMKVETISYYHADRDDDIYEWYTETVEEIITDLITGLISEIKKEEKRIEVNNR